MKRNYAAFLLAALLLATETAIPLWAARQGKTRVITAENPWQGKRVAFLGDSITDKGHIGTEKNYWQYLEEMLGLEALVYGINGHQWSDLPGQAERLKAEQGEAVDAILIFAGTNDFNAGVPLGSWYEEREESVEVSGPKQVKRLRRTPVMDGSTFRGRINRLLSYLKENYPTKQIILLTPLHRSYARFGDDNIQPDESYANARGLFIDAYVDVIKEAGNVWAVPVIDLNSLSGLYPNAAGQARYFHNQAWDRLHPNAAGHYRMAKVLQRQLLTLPADFDESRQE